MGGDSSSASVFDCNYAMMNVSAVDNLGRFKRSDDDDNANDEEGNAGVSPSKNNE